MNFINLLSRITIEEAKNIEISKSKIHKFEEEDIAYFIKKNDDSSKIKKEFKYYDLSIRELFKQKKTNRVNERP